MKNWKKNGIAAAILVTVCAGIYVNYLYTEENTAVMLDDTLDAEKVMGEDTLVLSQDAQVLAAEAEIANTATDYFAAVRLSRQEARDSAIDLLEEAASDSDVTKAEESAAQLDEIVETALSEARIESLVIAKGYTDCVAYMSNEGISVAVAAPEGGLQEEDVAVIADIVMSQSGYGLSDIRIVEVS